MGFWTKKVFHLFQSPGQFMHIVFLGRFPIHTGPTPQTMLDACVQNFFSEFSTLYRVGEGELQENFEKDALF